MKIEQIAEMLTSARISADTEVAMNRHVRSILENREIIFLPEYRLGKRDRIDFYVEGGTGIELKVKGSAKIVYRQLERYCQSEEINGIILVTGKSMGMPPKINGRSIFVISTGRAWL